jgi:acylphosphatase
MVDSPAAIVRVQLTIRGRVQGVYYRASMLQEAQKLGLTGWVRNCHDGSVEAMAQGTKDQLENLISWCWQGPPGAKVTQINVQWQAAQKSEREFSIRR